MSKFADGPWKITHSEMNGYRVSDQSGWGVAVVLKDVNDKENANLIAAAPTMLDALKFSCNICKVTADFCESCEVCPVGAAIRAAKG